MFIREFYNVLYKITYKIVVYMRKYYICKIFNYEYVRGNGIDKKIRSRTCQSFNVAACPRR